MGFPGGTVVKNPLVNAGWASSSVLIQKSRFRALGICFINGLPVAPALCCVFIPVFIPNSDLCFLIEI